MPSIEITKITDPELKKAAEYADSKTQNPNGLLEEAELADFFSKASESNCSKEDILTISNKVKEKPDTSLGKYVGGAVGAAAGGIAADKLCSKINNKALLNAIPRDYRQTVVGGKPPLKPERCVMLKQPMRGGRWGAALAVGVLALGALGACIGGKVQEEV